MLFADYSLAVAMLIFAVVVVTNKRNVVDFSLFVFGSFAIAGILFGVFQNLQSSVSFRLCEMNKSSR